MSNDNIAIPNSPIILNNITSEENTELILKENVYHNLEQNSNFVLPEELKVKDDLYSD